MNVQDYRAAGYSLSLHIDQAAVTRAEREVRDAYIVPILGSEAAYDEENETAKAATMGLAFLLLSLRQVVSTRVGGKVKMTETSNTPTRTDVMQQNAMACHSLIVACRNAEDANVNAAINDICGIYFKSNYFNTI